MIDMKFEWNSDCAFAAELFAAEQMQKSLIRRVIACTDTLVNQALQANWTEVLDGMQERRRLLQVVIDNDDGRLQAEVLALQSAVEESERAMMRVIAHAIASTRTRGASFAMYH